MHTAWRITQALTHSISLTPSPNIPYILDPLSNTNNDNHTINGTTTNVSYPPRVYQQKKVHSFPPPKKSGNRPPWLCYGQCIYQPASHPTPL
ncbi:uncharacterized protein EI97DRAFT_322981 [Westerdykella ornata]|uniref:Uncharacterized protein n=1 Tax=Westerdykella ornata TaxID=318751 RepID=A0A6A6JPE5_WESOR|nr:uncharacterized protein EI97DRAFT_322981 [Westerdykella ornata]KAF2276819.1 hypothetical protein EI97DRAFT_322981 [Westerdykella ornata]